MSQQVTLENLVQRVEALENAVGLGKSGRQKDWRRVIGKFGDSEFMREVDEECRRAREAERDAARLEASPE